MEAHVQLLDKVWIPHHLKVVNRENQNVDFEDNEAIGSREDEKPTGATQNITLDISTTNENIFESGDDISATI